MALLKRTSAMGLVGTIGMLLVALTAQMSMTGQAFAHYRNDGNEVVSYGPNACTVVTDLPAYQPATCVKHKTELDDGVTETKNSYVTQASADAVRQAFEASFQQNGWTVLEADQDMEDQEWEYTIDKGLRHVEVKIGAQDPDEGSGTEFSITEK